MPWSCKLSMQIKELFAIAGVAALLGCASNQPQPAGNSGGPLAQLECFKTFETRRVSSCKPDWRNTNGDCIPLAPGASASIAELQGPGKIVHLWFTVSHADPEYASKVTVRIYWDGEEHPSVECPLGDFFGIGHGVDKSFMSLPIRVTPKGERGTATGRCRSASRRGLRSRTRATRPAGAFTTTWTGRSTNRCRRTRPTSTPCIARNFRA